MWLTRILWKWEDRGQYIYTWLENFYAEILMLYRIIYIYILYSVSWRDVNVHGDSSVHTM